MRFNHAVRIEIADPHAHVHRADGTIHVGEPPETSAARLVALRCLRGDFVNPRNVMHPLGLNSLRAHNPVGDSTDGQDGGLRHGRNISAAPKEGSFSSAWTNTFAMNSS